MFAARRRHFVVHSAHKTVGVSLASLDLEAGRETFGEELCPAEQPTLRVCLVTGPGDDQATFSAEILTEYLRSVRAGPWDPICCRTSDDWADLGDLAACHCAVLFLDRQLPAEWLAVAADRAQAGGGLIGLRAAHGPWLCPATRGSVLFGAECLGRHINSSKPAVRIAPAAALHPTVAGVRPFVAAGDLAVVRTLGAEAVLVGSALDRDEKVAWVCRCGAGRGFCTTLGHPADFRQGSFLRLLANAVAWTSKGDVCR